MNPGLIPAALPPLGDKEGEPQPPACQDLQVLEEVSTQDPWSEKK